MSRMKYEGKTTWMDLPLTAVEDVAGASVAKPQIIKKTV